jgi:hypothetical protein
MAGEYFSLIVNLAIYIDISNIIVSINEVDPQTVKKTIGYLNSLFLLFTSNCLYS